MGFHVVTGAFGYSGKYIAQKLLANSLEVKHLPIPQIGKILSRVKLKPCPIHLTI